MNLSFKIVALIALTLGFWNMTQGSTQPNSDLEMEFAKLKIDQKFLIQKIEELENIQNKSLIREAAAFSTSAKISSQENIIDNRSLKLSKNSKELQTIIDEMVEVKIEKLGKEGKLVAKNKSDLGDRNSDNVGEKSLKEIGKDIGLTDFEIDFIDEAEKKMHIEVVGLFKKEGETTEEFAVRLRNMENNPGQKAEFIQNTMSALIQGGGIAKVMKIQADYEEALKDRLGDEKYNKYKNHPNSKKSPSMMGLDFSFSKHR